jgi:flavin reductase (DIM6/NTAB) family NADH-FMN oxidoreductase RutF
MRDIWVQAACVKRKYENAKVASANDAPVSDDLTGHHGEVEEKPDEGGKKPEKRKHHFKGDKPIVSTHYGYYKSFLEHTPTLEQELSELVPKLTNDLRGMTLSSFSTVSLTEQRSIVSFNIRTPSATFDALSKQATFLIHILEANQAGADLAARFSRGRGGAQDFEGLDVVWKQYDNGRNNKKKKGIGCRTMLPCIKSPGVKQVLGCKLIVHIDKYGRKHPHLQLEDHMVLFGSVKYICDGEGSALRESTAEVDWQGLGYAEGQYRTFGDVIPVEHVTREPIVEESVVRVPVGEKYVVEEASTAEPITEEAITEELVIEMPAIEEHLGE